MPDQKTPRKKNPSYYVFLVGADHAFTQIGTEAISASSRGAAAERAAKDAKLEIDEKAPPSFLVITAAERQIIRPRVKVERSVSWEPMPELPAVLQSTGERAQAATP